ncbi:hypothetical protein [Candidatus Pseudothioglobus sp. Uisw_050_01]|uniref:hypothetical protein n=1 Tax=Candidatus Pseudothioglobus sp. Uisw_050_01 TaxID=3230997 RepID=UPI003A85B75B
MLRRVLKKIPFSISIASGIRFYLSFINKNIELINMCLIQRRYKGVVASKRRKLFEKKIIKVVFFITQKQLWAGQSLYDEFFLSDYFEPLIVVFPNYEDKVNTIESTINDNYVFFKKKGMNVLKGYDSQKNIYLSAGEINADIIFYDQPSPQIHKSLLWNKLSKNSLVCYIPYGFKIAAFFQAHFNMPLQNCSWKVFAESEWHKKQFSIYGPLKGKNVVTSGFPKLDEYNKPNSNISRSFKKIIWAPHWSIGLNKDSYSTFDENYNFFLEYASLHPNIYWVFKPHQRLKHYLVEIGFMSQDEVNAYYNAWDKLTNASFYNDPEYFDIFKDSDALITDCGSFLAEYLPTKKPILRLVKLNNIRYNEVGEKLVKSYYTSTNNNLIKTFITDVVINKEDVLLDKRLANIPLVRPNIEGAGKFIVDYIETELNGENLSG